eukprot:9501484-Pyramimonas_sp.AAC.1
MRCTPVSVELSTYSRVSNASRQVRAGFLPLEAGEGGWGAVQRRRLRGDGSLRPPAQLQVRLRDQNQEPSPERLPQPVAARVCRSVRSLVPPAAR